jgi:hypothetical protein
MKRHTPWLEYLETAPPHDHEERVFKRAESLLQVKRTARSRRLFLGWFVAPAGAFASFLILFKLNFFKAFYSQQDENNESSNDMAALAPAVDFDLFLDLQNEDLELLAELDLLEDIDALEDWDNNSSEEES